jgi:DNA-binding transcriptional MerR regulator
VTPTTQPFASTYTLAQVARLFNVSERRLRYWSQTKFIAPSRADDGRLHYSFEDLVSIRVAKQLLDSGLTLQRVRKCLENLRAQMPRLQAPLASLRFESERESIVVADGQTRFEVNSGQLVFDLEVEAVRRDVAQVVCLPWVNRNRTPTSQPSESDPRAWFEKGVEWESQWDGEDPQATEFIEAKHAYEKSLEIDPHFAPSFTNLGTLLAQSGDLDHARDYFDLALAHDPEQPEARCNLAELALRGGEHRLAIEGFRAVLRSFPDYLEAHYGLARALMAAGVRTQALVHLERFCAAVDRVPRSQWDDELERRRNCAEVVMDTLRGQHVADPEG